MKHLLALLPFVLLFSFAGCDGDGSAKSDVKQSYGKPTENVFHRVVYTNTTTAANNPYIGRVVGTVSSGGKDYSRYLLSNLDVEGNPISDTEGTELWVAPFPIGADGTMSVTGIDDHTTITGVFAPPLTIDLNAPLGIEQPVDATYTGTIPNVTGPQTVTITGGYTIESRDATVSTPMGVVSGCTHVTVAGTLSGDNLPAVVKNIPLSGEAWYHESFGLVKASLPQLGMEGNMEATWDVDDPTGEYRTIKRTGVVSAANPSWTLSTDQVNGEWDADKMVHAKMLLEVRWADGETAKNSTQPVATHPAVRIGFSTAWGTFGYEMIESPVSIFHPEDNGKGYKFYYAYVDEAAKNEPGENGIIYQITVQTTDPTVTPDIKATGRIYYHTIPVP